jgi:hypothetical protein
LTGLARGLDDDPVLEASAAQGLRAPGLALVVLAALLATAVLGGVGV